MKAETREDVENIEAWAKVIGDLLQRIPSKQRSAVLALVTENEEAARQEHKAADWSDLKPFDFTSTEWMNTPEYRHRNVIMRLKSLVVQVFIRDITNNHSLERATEILLAHHRHGSGSGLLEDYLRNLSIPRN
jgi:hypothetical protein